MWTPRKQVCCPISKFDCTAIEAKARCEGDGFILRPAPRERDGSRPHWR
jgi:hypothetical protein